MILFALSWWLRRAAPDSPSRTALALSFIAVLVALLTGWLGAELVDRLGVGVDSGAHLNAPNSLSRPRADQGQGKAALRRVA
ncbi:MAG: rane protein [Candidatus Sulfotelmatobacter sp.]|nr:rane protein [Candidatus Sulfotelmatobacter sp.]